MRKIPRIITRNRCACGARRDKPARRCRKCLARARWYRRKEWRGRKTPGCYLNGKK